jgi:hypothetical protein
MWRNLNIGAIFTRAWIKMAKRHFVLVFAFIFLMKSVELEAVNSGG